ncbi:hypothetical protein TVNIR_0607 [Thioalkalivibrio nitratireducens DSM 14787]|uniref:Uncharacterized protein n=1 Tax=Thioalkalivibrio nitratireducens (strain DSM 14787 / UNIQEM 213 / ALEN2) TaxID=1255043 RepID=L0DTG8_THIND|nr:hypothetical protein [Thioalkalivibrio nitratireducens]AGA32308.1 hypothetical protein TVNIR_0607 [Thioalkalivibrio nitratireducens DSM 14787]
MTTHHYPMQVLSPYPQHPAALQPQQELNRLLDAARTGMMVGGAGAAALHLHRMRDQGIGWQEALGSSVKTSLQAGVATAAASAVGRMFAGNPVLAAAATLATGTAVMYALTARQQESSHE